MWLSPRLAFIGLVLLTLSWLVNDHYWPWISFHSEAVAFAGLAFLLARRVTSPTSLKIPRIAKVVAACSLLPLLQVLLGMELFWGDVFLGWFYLAAAAAAIALAFDAVKSDGSKPTLWLMHSLWVAAFISACIGLLQWLQLHEWLGLFGLATNVGDRAMANLGQANHLATLLLMGLVALTYAYEKHSVGRAGYYAAGGFISFVLVLTESRTGMLGAAAVFCFLVAKTHQKNQMQAFRLTSTVLFVWAGLFVLLIGALPTINNGLLLGTGRGIELTDNNGRLLIWQQIGYAVAQSAWLGYGWNQIPAAHAVGAVAYPGELYYLYSHNVALDLLAWFGVPLGVLLFLGAAWWVVSGLWRVVDINSVYAMAGLLPFMMHSLLEFPFAYAYFLIPVCLLAGVVQATLLTPYSTQKNLAGARFFLGCWLVLGFWTVFEYLKVEEDFRVVRFENVRVGKTPEGYEVPQIHLLSHLGTMLHAARLRPAPNMSKADLENLRRVALRFPYGTLSLRYALALGLNGDPVAATHQMKVVRGMYGERYYGAAKLELRKLQLEKYPQLAAVSTP